MQATKSHCAEWMTVTMMIHMSQAQVHLFLLHNPADKSFHTVCVSAMPHAQREESTAVHIKLEQCYSGDRLCTNEETHLNPFHFVPTNFD